MDSWSLIKSPRQSGVLQSSSQDQNDTNLNLSQRRSPLHSPSHSHFTASPFLRGSTPLIRSQSVMRLSNILGFTGEDNAVTKPISTPLPQNRQALWLPGTTRRFVYPCERIAVIQDTQFERMTENEFCDNLQRGSMNSLSECKYDQEDGPQPNGSVKQEFLTGHTRQIGILAVSCDGTWIATSESLGPNPITRIWQSQPKKCLCELSDHSKTQLAISFSGDDRFLATAGTDDQARVHVVIWDLWPLFQGESQPELV